MTLAEELRSMFLIDPRTNNAVLPAEASISYKFGARSYLTTVYPNYTWRNGMWFEITPSLSFKKDTIKRHKRVVSCTATCDTWRDFSHITDGWDPICIGTHRYFVLYVSVYSGVVYDPSKKAICSVENSGLSLYNPKFEDMHYDEEYAVIFNIYRDSFAAYK